MVWHLRHIHAIAAVAPEGRVDLLTKPRSQADRLLAADPAVERVHWLHRGPGQHDGPGGLLRLAALLRRGDYETVWILHGSWRYGLAARLAGIRARIGYGKGVQRWFLTRPGLPDPGPLGRHAIEAATSLLAQNGVAFTEEEPRLPVATAGRREVEARYGHLPRPWIALGIGSSEPFKQWGRENFTDLAAALADPPRRTLFLLGGPGEADSASWIVDRLRAAGGGAESAIGLPLEQTVALTACCQLYLGNDTGLLNIAATTGVEAVGLFGGSPPLGYSRRIHPVLPLEGQTGMAAITLPQVLAAFQALGFDS